MADIRKCAAIISDIYSISDQLQTICKQPIRWNSFRLHLQYAQELEGNGFIDDLPVEESQAFVKRLLEAVEEETGCTINYALWLADKATVENVYDGTDEDIDAYHTSSVVLSELGYDGTLYGYEQRPEEIEKS